MFGRSSSAYVRFLFQIANPGDLESLTLRLKFEDGFVAYLNGVEVSQENAPESISWDALATATRSPQEAVEFADFDLTSDKDLLRVGLNVLAVHLLNSAIDSPGLLLVAELVATTRFGPMQSRYFPVPTPGRANLAGVEVLGPLFSQVAHNPKTPAPGQDIIVTARLREAFAPVASATLRYRVMFGSETTTPLLDDGLHGDGEPGDGLYGGVIPGSAFGPGQMARWYLLAFDTAGHSSRWPAFQNPSRSPAYLGTVVSDSTLVSPLPIFHWFVEKPAAADGFGGTRASVYFEGEFYDNVFIIIWQVVAAGNASFHGAVSHDMGTALADRMFHLHVQTAIDAFLAHAIAHDFAPEVMAYLKVRPDKLDDTQAQLANDHLVGASPRGWEDISSVLRAGLSEDARRVFVQGRIGAANAAEFFGVLRELQAAVDVVKLLDAKPGPETLVLLPRTLDGLYGMVYGLLAACRDAGTMQRALAIVEQLPELGASAGLPLREGQTLAMELLLQRALESGLENAVLDSPAYQRYSERRRAEGLGG